MHILCLICKFWSSKSSDNENRRNQNEFGACASRFGKVIDRQKRDRCKCRKKDRIRPLQKVNKQMDKEYVRDIYIKEKKGGNVGMSSSKLKGKEL